MAVSFTTHDVTSIRIMISSEKITVAYVSNDMRNMIVTNKIVTQMHHFLYLHINNYS